MQLDHDLHGLLKFANKGLIGQSTIQFRSSPECKNSQYGLDKISMLERLTVSNCENSS